MRRALLALLVFVALVPVAVLLAGGLLLDSAAVRTRVIDAVSRATGFAARLDGPLRLAWGVVPAIEANGLVLLNPAGFSREAIATVRRVEAGIALLPLLGGRIDIRSVTVEKPELVLERDVAGRGNWERPPAPPPSEAPAGPPRERTPVVIGRVVVHDARVVAPWGEAFEAPLLAVSPGGGPVEGRVLARGAAFTLAGRTGPLDRGAPTLELTTVGGGLAASLSGVVGGELAATASAPDLAALAGLAGRALPALREVSVAVKAGPGGLGAMNLAVGSSALGEGVLLSRLVASAEGLDGAVGITVNGGFRALPLAASFELGSLRALLAGGAVGVKAMLQTEGGQATVQGEMRPAALAMEGSAAGTLADLGRVGVLAGVAMPGLRAIAFSGRLMPGPGGAGAVLRGLRITAAQGDLTGDLAGDLAVGWAPRISVRGTVVSQRLDLNGPAVPAAQAPAPPAAPATPATPAPAAAAAPLVRSPLIPAVPLPFAALRAADADLRLTVGQIRWRGVEFRAAEMRLRLDDGRLRVDPAQLVAPGGAGASVQAVLTADATTSPPTASLTLRAAGLDVAALDGSGALTGTADLDVSLAGAGADTRAFALSLRGHAGVALIDGEVENRALAAGFEGVLRAVNLPVDTSGRSRVRCMAARVDAADGVARVAALALDATRLRLEGEGTVALAEETVDMRLRPTVRIGPAGVLVPVRVAGPARAPAVALERGAIAPGRLGFSIGGAGGDPCPAALAAARDGRAGAMPR